MSLAGNKLGPYEILAPIGKGGMGEVFRAHDTRLDRDVAIKVSAERFTERFEREARTIASLNHPNICTLHDVGPNYLVMELVDGETLADRIRQGPVPQDEALGIARQIADALDVAHDRGIVHRDLKPGNVKVRPDGTVKVLDFGLAKMGGGPTVQTDNSPTVTVGETEAGMILGTASYMSPEQAKGKPVDKRADIYAFGLVLYEMLTGRRVHQGDTTTEVLASVIRDEPKWDVVPPSMRRLLQRCLEKDPQKRLRHIGDALELVTSEVPVAGADRSHGRSWPWVAATAALALVATVALWAPWHAEPNLQPARFEIRSTEETTFVEAGNVSLSPDGRWVVFAARGPDGVVRYWLRAIDSVEVRPLAETGLGGAAMPPIIWSADSRSIAFPSGGQLKRLDLSGGSTTTISEIRAYSSGTWNRDDVIIFGAVDGEISRVSAAGGAATPVTVRDASRKEGSHNSPQFLPDGRHFLYHRASTDARYEGVYVGSLDSRPEDQRLEPVLLSDRQAWYAPSATDGTGFLVFLRDTTLFAQPFDPERLRLSGDAVRIADRVGSFGPAHAGKFSVSENGVLAYRVGVSGAAHFQLTWLDRTGKPTGTVGDRGGYSSPSVSPDGTRIAVAQLDVRTGYSNIWVFDAAGKTSRQLTFNRGRDANPVWSPDGKSLVFASNAAGGQMDLYQKASDGSGEERLLLKSDQDKSPTSWSRDGFLLYTSVDPKTRGDLWVLPLSGDSKPAPFLRTEFPESGGVFSPDGRWIAYTSLEAGSPELWVRPFSIAKGEQSGSGVKWKVSKGGAIAPRWGPDGKELSYSWPVSQRFAVDVTTGPAFQAGPPSRLFSTTPTIVLPDVSSDGKRFLYALPEAPNPQSPIVVVLNWQAALRNK